MTILICSLSKAAQVAAQRKPSRMVSLLDPQTMFPALRVSGHLRMALHDIADHEDGCILPAETHVREILTFVNAWDQEAPILIHCWAGISRSTATALITACVKNPATDEEEIAWALRRASATANPNPRLVALADAELGRSGRLVKAARAIGRGYPAWPAIEEAEPFEIPSRFDGPTL
jgi:predicted protein tyrosine phosphatase